MHFEVLVEDLSGKKALDILIPKIIGISIHSGLLNTGESVIYPKISRAVPMPVSAFCLTNFSGCSGDMERHLLVILRTIQQR